MASTTFDVEKGGVRVHDQRISSSASNPSAFHDNHVYQSGATPLAVFQALIGITTDRQLGGSNKLQRPRLVIRRIFFPPKSVGGSNVGLYQRAINEEWKNRIAYFLSSYILNSIYILQILLAATFTALSAAFKDSDNISLTVLGAINTVVAGVLAWLKGQGIPNRFRRARDQYQNIVKEIEMAERLFAEYDQLVVDTANGEEKPDPKREVNRLHRMFETARQDQQNNYPDMYVSSQDALEKSAKDDEFKKDIRKKAEEAKTEFAKREQDLMERLKILEAVLKVSQGGERGVSPGGTS